MGTLVGRLDEHDGQFEHLYRYTPTRHACIRTAEADAVPSGPVRGVAFHAFRDLLVTGGDDYKVRVWGTRGATLARQSGY